MNEELTTVVAELGADGIQAFYVYLAVDYVSLWVLIGLLVWGIRTIWNHVKEGF